MIDVSQWRASVGLWNYCQASSSTPANGHHSHSFKTALKSKSGSTTSGEETFKLPGALSLIALFLLLFHSLSSLRYILVIPPTGDVELNPGPIIDDQPDIFLLLQWLQPLVEWQPFGLFLPGITQQDITTIEDFEIDTEQSDNDPSTSSAVSVINKTLTSAISGDTPNDILRMNYATLIDALTNTLYRVTNGLYAKGLIPMETVNHIQTAASSDVVKSGQLMSVIQRQLESSLNPEQYLTKMCQVMVNQQHCTLTRIATSIAHQLGYADNMRQHYKHQPIVATDWPPRIGKDFFGRLALVEKQDSSIQAKSAWHMLRGQVDKTVKLTENKEISVENVLQPTNSSLSLRVVIDGPPGIGKTTLCRKLLNLWCNKKLVYQQYDLVLYCPLRNSKIATATTLADLFVCQRYEVPMVAEWFEKKSGEGLLIIFDGWDELCKQLRQSSLALCFLFTFRNHV
uniref:NACHT domain-containing protein n=2 Tax=Amphimedon queenslandica TaxID=400682 RepID=A0A1X7UDS7_AMPQE